MRELINKNNNKRIVNLNQIKNQKGEGKEFKELFFKQNKEKAEEENSLKKIRHASVENLKSFRPFFLKSTNRTAAKILTRLRNGSSNLNDDLARKRSIDKEKKCPVCNAKKYETSYHFLTTCSAFSTERTALLEANNWSHIQGYKLFAKFLGETQSKRDINNLRTWMPGFRIMIICAHIATLQLKIQRWTVPSF